MKSGRKVGRPTFKKPSREVSERMKRVRSTGTGLETAMKMVLKGLKLRYEIQPKIYGRPDFRVSSTNVLIFCDSSFWHGRRKKELTGEAFGRNKAFWTTKLMENKKRDARISRKLRREGWKVLRFWDTDVLNRPEKVEERLVKVLEENV